VIEISSVGAFHRNLPQVTKIDNRVVASIPILVTCGRFLWKAPTSTDQINSQTSSVFTEQHALSSEPQCRATLPIVSNAAPSQPTSTTTSLPAITAPSADFNHKSPGHRSAFSLKSKVPDNRCLFSLT
jgi:hypothetical protein